jgi:hypothetical protein
MILKTLIKNPALMIGILLMGIFVMDLHRRGILGTPREKLTPSSCKAVRVMLDRRIPASWKSDCEGQTFNNLSVDITFVAPSDEALAKLEGNALRALLYRELANDLAVIARNSPSDNLERTDYIRVKLIHPKLEINALTEGRHIVKLATLTDPKLIAEHLKVTVKVQENPIE